MSFNKLKKYLFEPKLKPLDAIFLVLFLALLFALFQIRIPSSQWLGRDLSIERGYLAKQGEDGLYYALDNEHSRLLCFDKDAILRFRIDNPSDEISSGLYIDDFAVSGQGIYLSVSQWDGMSLAREAILLYDHKGRFVRTITNRDYSDLMTNKHRFNAIDTEDGQVRFIERMSDELIAGERHIPYENAFDAVADAAYCKDTLYVLDKTGRILAFSGEENEGEEVYNKREAGESELEPFRLCVDADGGVYFTDIKNGAVRRVDPETKKSEVIVDETGSLTVQRTQDGAFLLMEEGMAVRTKEGKSEYIVLHKSFSTLSWQALCVALFACLLLLGLLLIIRIINHLVRREYSTVELSSIMSIVMVGLVSLLLGYTMIQSFRESYFSKIEEQVKSTAYMVANQIRGDRVERLSGGGGFGDEDYESLVAVMERSFPSQVDFFNQVYCNILALDENQNGIAICYLDQSIGDYFPLDEEESEKLREVYRTKADVTNQSAQDVSGTYLSIKVPIFSADDRVVGAVDVGAETYLVNDIINAIVFKTLMSVVIILMMVWVVSSEIMSFGVNLTLYRRERDIEHNDDALPGHLLRLLIFLVFSAYNMATTFLPVYLIRRTDAVPERWREMAGAAPIAVNLFIIGLMSLFCANLVRRFGLKKVLTAATVFSFAGNALMFAVPGIWTISLGLLLDGIGVGLITNAIYVLITYIREPVNRTWALSVYNGACLSGINFGMLLGSLLAVTIGQRLVFMIVALSWLSLSLLGRQVVSRLDRLLTREDESGDNEEAPYPLRSFIGSKSVWSFMVLIQNPFILFGSFVFYFLPLYCDDHGYGETVCSLFIMLYSEIAVLAGDKMTKWIGERLGSCSIYAACMANVAALGWFCFNQSPYGMIIALIIMGIGASFGKPVQQDYYLSLKESRGLGEDRAMGIYNFTENIGESLGPIVFGRLMAQTPLAPVMTGFLGIITGANALHFLLNKRTIMAKNP